MRRRGRPKNDVVRDNKLTVRITEEALEQLNFACDLTGDTKLESSEKSIYMYYNLIKYCE